VRKYILPANSAFTIHHYSSSTPSYLINKVDENSKISAINNRVEFINNKMENVSDRFGISERGVRL